MKKQAQQINADSDSFISRSLRHPLLRFLFAGFLTIVVVFILLFFMRYLIMGYDRSATDAITRYFTLKTIVLPDDGEVRPARVERPTERPEFSGMDEPDFRKESEAMLNEQSAAIPVNQTPQPLLEKDFQLPQLEAAPLSTQEKLQQIKQKILADGP